MSRDPWLYIADILEACRRVIAYTDGVASFEEFETDLKTFDAVVRNIQVIGEAAKLLSEEILAKYPDLPWKDIRGMRDKLVHDYFGISPRAVWDTAKNDVPELQRILTDTR